MRTLATILIIVAVLFGGSLASYQFIHSNTTSLITQLSSVEASTADKKWQAAQLELGSASQHWDQTKAKLAFLLDHQDIDDIDLSMSRLSKYLAIQDLALALGEVTTLKMEFQQLKDAENLNLKNIL